MVFSFPQELKKLKIWLLWRLEHDPKTGRDTKIPYSPITGKAGRVNDPSTWGTYEQALEMLQKYNFSGLGVAFSEEFGIIGIDIDKCLDENGQPNEVASGILAELSQIPTYIEISPSGRGLHIFIRGTLPKGGRKNSETGVEMYSTKRYFTMTGNRWHNCADVIAVDNGAIAAIHTNYIKKKKSQNKQSMNGNQDVSRGTSCLSDEQLLEKAMATDNTFESLWEGNHSRYNSQSEADMALCGKLTFWANCDVSQIDRLFRLSGLMREKRDSERDSSGETYGQRTINKACVNATKTYTVKAKSATDVKKEKRPANVYVQDGRIVLDKGKSPKELTNYIFVPKYMVASKEEGYIVCECITDTGEVYEMTFQTDDIAAFVLVFPPDDADGKYHVLPFFWIPENNMIRRVRKDKVLYQKWHQEGFLNATDGNIIHYDFIEQKILELSKIYNIKEVMYDQWGAVQMCQNLSRHDFEMVEFVQGFKSFTEPSKELFRLVLDERFIHGGNPVLRWCFENVYVETDAAANIKPSKKKSVEKIDGAVACIMALDGAVKSFVGAKKSVYESRGLIILGGD